MHAVRSDVRLYKHLVFVISVKRRQEELHNHSGSYKRASVNALYLRVSLSSGKLGDSSEYYYVFKHPLSATRQRWSYGYAFQGFVLPLVYSLATSLRFRLWGYGETSNGMVAIAGPLIHHL